MIETQSGGRKVRRTCVLMLNTQGKVSSQHLVKHATVVNMFMFAGFLSTKRFSFKHTGASSPNRLHPFWKLHSTWLSERQCVFDTINMTLFIWKSCVVLYKNMLIFLSVFVRYRIGWSVFYRVKVPGSSLVCTKTIYLKTSTWGSPPPNPRTLPDHFLNLEFVF